MQNSFAHLHNALSDSVTLDCADARAKLRRILCRVPYLIPPRQFHKTEVLLDGLTGKTDRKFRGERSSMYSAQ